MPAVIVITHDRTFLDRVATRIVELDRGLLRSYPGNFAAYQARKAVELEAEATARRKFDQFWAQEEAWIRKGVEARRTRDEGRVRRLESLRRERSERRARLGNVKLAVDAGERSGRLVAELSHVTKAFGGRVLVRDLTLRIMRGDRLGLIGANGAGKSTLLKLILGELPPDSGTVRLGTKLSIAYFDQLREELDGERTLAETISPGSEWVETAGGRKHVLSYLGDFLFPPQRADTPVRALSGGERNRLLLARLFARPANLLVLDEPTNDLDIESLDLLESTLQTYPGTLLLVSHDRTFLDNVVTQTLVAESRGDGDVGGWYEYAGGYSDWVAQRPRREGVAAREATTSKGTAGSAAKAPSPGASRRSGTPAAKLTFAERRELAALPDELEALEREQHALTERMCRPGLPSGDAPRRSGPTGSAPRKSSTRSPGSSSAGASSTAVPAARGRASSRLPRGRRGPARSGQNATSMSPSDTPGSLPCHPGPGAPFTICAGYGTTERLVGAMRTGSEGDTGARQRRRRTGSRQPQRRGPHAAGPRRPLQRPARGGDGGDEHPAVPRLGSRARAERRAGRGDAHRRHRLPGRHPVRARGAARRQRDEGRHGNPAAAARRDRRRADRQDGDRHGERRHPRHRQEPRRR